MAANLDTAALTVVHRRRLREVWRSAGWPCRDAVEVDLLAAGLLERRFDAEGRETLHLTAPGIQALAATLARNRAALDAHEAMVACVAEQMQRAGRIVWRRLSLRAPLPPLSPLPQCPAMEAAPDLATSLAPAGALFDVDDRPAESGTRWVMAMPDVFSIRHTTVQAYCEPAVHEIKVRRADLLADLRRPDKGAAYRALCSQCWYVLGPGVGSADDVPAEYGVLLASAQGLEVARPAPRRAVMPGFALWMALARANAEPPLEEEPAQSPLRPAAQSELGASTAQGAQGAADARGARGAGDTRVARRAATAPRARRSNP
jgi:hypothetical protein